jgi:chromosome segregation ATPase
MDELKKSVLEVKKELDDELQKINGVSAKLDKNLSLIDDVREEQKHVFLAHKQELDSMEGCVKYCQIQIAQHDERLKSYEANSNRQNGSLQKLSNIIDDVAHGVNEIVKKVNAMDTSIANRMNQIERNGIKRETAHDKSADEKLNLAKEKADKDVDDLRAEWLKSRIAFNWKLVTAIGTFAFLLLVVIITIETHTFGGLP